MAFIEQFLLKRFKEGTITIDDIPEPIKEKLKDEISKIEEERMISNDN